MPQVNCERCKVRIERSDCFRGWLCPECKRMIISDVRVAQNSDLELLMGMHEGFDAHL